MRSRRSHPTTLLLGTLLLVGGCAPALPDANDGARHEPGHPRGPAPRGTLAEPAAAEGQEDYVRKYAASGPPAMADVAEFADYASFPPRLKAEPSDEEPKTQPSELDVDEPRLEAARRAALAHPEVRAALGERFVETAIGANVRVKVEGGRLEPVTIGIEFFSYSLRGAVRAGVVGEEVVSVRRLDPAYRPPETAAEIERAAVLVAADGSRAEYLRDTEAQGLLTPCEESVRCLYVQFVREGRITFAATVDLINERVFDEMVDPDADVKESPEP